MINELMRAIFKLVFFLLRWIFNIVLLPLKPVLALFPTFDEFLTDATSFFDEYLVKAIAFSREVFLNMTGFPQAMITATVSFSLAIIGIIGTIKIIAFIKNLWSTFKGGGAS